MDWENKFSSIFKETEFNLAKVKERLDASRASQNLSQSLNEGRYNLGPSLEQSVLSTSLRNPAVNPFAKKPELISPAWAGASTVTTAPFVTQGLSHHSDDVEITSSDPSPGLVALLSDKIDAQNRTIEALSHSVRELEEERGNQSQQISRLREEVSSLSARIAERGVHVQTERKVEAWQQEVMTQLQLVLSELALSKQVQQQRTESQYDNQLTAVLREISDIKKNLREETGDVRNTLESLKSRMVLMEVDMHQSQADNKGLHQRQNVLDRSVRGVLNTHTSASRDLNSALETSRDKADAEIAQLKRSLRGVTDKLRTVENDLHKKSLTASGKSQPKTSTSRKEKTDIYNRCDDVTPDLSDLELDLTPDFSDDLDTPDDGRRPGMSNYEDFDLDDLTPDELTAHDLDDLKTRDLDDVKTADTCDLNLTAEDLDDNDLYPSDEDLSIDHLK